MEKKKKILPTYPNIFEHATPNIYINFFSFILHEKEINIGGDC